MTKPISARRQAELLDRMERLEAGYRILSEHPFVNALGRESFTVQADLYAARRQQMLARAS